MSLTKPRFQCGSYDVSPEHPSDWSVVPLLGISEENSISGVNLRDVSWRKYQYVLTWDAISKADYDSLEELFNEHYDTGENIIFTYRKWPQSSSGVAVAGKLSDRAKVAGSGEDFFYSKVEVVLTEVNPR